MICGIDPGISGAVAFLSEEGCICHDMPVLQIVRGGKNKREIDVHALAALLRQPVEHAYIEQVGAMPGQGTSSMFSFGKSYGTVIGIFAALNVPMTFVPPRRWKSTLGVPASKDGARLRASQLLPLAAGQWTLVKHDGRAEAALIALYGSGSSVSLQRRA